MQVSLETIADGRISVRVSGGAPPVLLLRIGVAEVGRLEPKVGEPELYIGAVPMAALNKGLTVAVVTASDSLDPLLALPFLIGSDQGTIDAASELAQLRAELELLKAAFRRAQRV